MEVFDSRDGEGDATEVERVAAIRLLNQQVRPAAFVGINDVTAVGMLAGDRESGLRTPRAVSVVGSDGIHLCEITDPPISTVRQPPGLIMNSAMELLIGRMEGKNTKPPEHVTLAPELIIIESTARCASAS